MNNSRHLISIVTLLIIANLSLFGQCSNSYTLFAPLGQKTTYLINDKEEVVRTWESGLSPALSAYLLDDKSLLRPAALGRNKNTPFAKAGGAGGKVERFDWEGNITWEFEHISNKYLLHHDVEYLPNGNILMIAWEYKSGAEAIEAGRNPSLLSDDSLWPDKIIEVKPEGNSGGTIVWEWHVWDHLIQDFDESKTNYGSVSDHPEKIDINYIFNQPGADWNHTNGIDYNEELDQILVTVRHFSEIWIIDHNTTTEEAAGSAGDLLYRWGNPQTYGRGTESDQKLFVPHNGHWIESSHPGTGDILIFNNGKGRPGGNYSTVDQITPPMDINGNYQLNDASAFGPADQSWTYQSDPPTDFFADHISGTQRLPGGNTLICEGTKGRFFEVTSDGETVWEYLNPYSYTNQEGKEDNSVFRAVRYFLDDDDPPLEALSYLIVDTGQEKFYNNQNEISVPSHGDSFYGQDAQHLGHQPSYTNNGDGTITDNITGLMWQKSPDMDNDGDIDADDKISYSDAMTGASTFSLAGYDDWRLPTIKELYSLIMFYGQDPSGYEGTSTDGLVPFINTDYFDFGFGDTDAGERIIDAQFATSTLYVSTTMNGSETMFGVNFADGRIKGYPTGPMPGQNKDKGYYVLYVRGNTDYGKNDFTDNEDGTITDNASGLMWQQNDSETGLNWQEALSWVDQKNSEKYLGYEDWRLPDVKELQSIVDYTRAPAITNSPAIDPLFTCSEITDEGDNLNYPFYWSGTTHANMRNGANASYVCFGEALGFMEQPPNSGNYNLMDVHGAGAQRSDPKTGNPDDYPYGHGPQGDVIRIYNYVRLVRNVDGATGIGDYQIKEYETKDGVINHHNYPNPLNSSTTISFDIAVSGPVSLKIYDNMGQFISTLADGYLSAGTYSYNWEAVNHQSGIFYYVLKGNSFTETKMMVLVK